MAKRRQTYESDDITVTFDPDVCIHSGVCVLGLPDVFDIKRQRWIRPELQPADVVAAQVMRCPSGALQFVISGGAGLVFKGSGFYATDYKRPAGTTEKADTTAEKAEKTEKSDSKPSPKKDSSSDK